MRTPDDVAKEAIDQTAADKAAADKAAADQAAQDKAAAIRRLTPEYRRVSIRSRAGSGPADRARSSRPDGRLRLYIGRPNAAGNGDCPSRG